MKCPHCTTGVHGAWSSTNLAQEKSPAGHDLWFVKYMNCPECGNVIIDLWRTPPGDPHMPNLRYVAWPQHATRPVAPEVEPRFAEDFRQASATLSVSPKASAAVSRRCLQDVIREKAGIKKPTLDAEIQELINSGTTPSWLVENLDAVRVVGNFAAHPTKSTNTGEVVDVEPGEAEFLLDVLEGLFDFYFIQPAKAKQQRAAINAKLQETGKPPLKAPNP